MATVTDLLTEGIGCVTEMSIFTDVRCLLMNINDLGAMTVTSVVFYLGRDIHFIKYC